MAKYVLDDAGLSIPTEPDILGDILGDYQSADPAVGFGPGADVTTDSPFYKIASRVAPQIALCWQGLRDLSGQFDPENASGQQLDRLGSMIGLRRRRATPSTVPGRIIGAPGTSVDAGAIVLYEPNNSRWELTGGVIPENGALEVTATAKDTGPIDAAASQGDWQVLSGQVLGFDAFESTDRATLGAPAWTDPEYRAELRNAARGRATYDAIVTAVRDVTDVSAVYLYVNPSLLPDPLTGLLGKQMRLVVQGGARTDIARALHETVGAPVDTVGAVATDIAPGNGQVLTYRFDRLKRRRGYLRLTYTGGNPKVPLPDDAAAIVLAAVAAVAAEGGSAFAPMEYGAAGLVALMTAAPGCVTKLVAEGRLDPADPWVEDAITLPLDEVIDVATAPTPAEVVSVAEDPIVVAGLATLTVDINGEGFPYTTEQYPALPTNGAAAIAAIANEGLDPARLVVDTDAGRVRFRTKLTGSAASIGFPLGGGAVAVALGLEGVQRSGSDGDVQVVLVP